MRRARLVGFEPDRYGPDGFPTLTAVYRADLTPGPIRCADDVAEVRWLPVTEIPFRSVAFSSMRRALRNYLGTTSR